MKFPLCLSLVSLTLAGCGTYVARDKDRSLDRQVSGDSQMYKHYQCNLDSVNLIATDYCHQRGKTAIVQSQNRIKEDRMSTTYVCR